MDNNPEKTGAYTEVKGEGNGNDASGAEILSQNSGNMPPFEEWREQQDSEEDEITYAKLLYSKGYLTGPIECSCKSKIFNIYKDRQYKINSMSFSSFII